MKQFKRIKGTQDILPPESRQWAALENLIHEIMERYNFHEIRTPVFEQTELFARGIGQLTDIVSKEMYSFQDRGKKQITLKPEMTAPVMRAFIENKMYAQQPIHKLYYIASLFRQEKPQAGRLRQFHQFGAETIGSADPAADIEMIDLAVAIYKKTGLKDLQLSINSVGDPLCRNRFRKILQDYIRPNLNLYCEDCKKRFETNPMRILDCKNESCIKLNEQAPKLTDYLCDGCAEHYKQLKSGLDNLGIAYRENPYLVRGLDYYTRTVFEITSGALGAQNAVCGGGRYDLLAEELGGMPTPATGFAAGMERLLLVLQSQQIDMAETTGLDVFIIGMENDARPIIDKTLLKLRNAGYRCDQDLLKRSIKAQMREANRQAARYVLIIGENELNSGKFAVKDMSNGIQTEIKFEDIENFLEQQKLI
ncbi:MAG: histidine--tRNA ligase [Calditrichaceae bacterium]|nr:histidine--tRNA ligase [Calditrichaceae bacterium]RQV96189.1 MAG: histidine--tRNA ligase [Calditrichota bacterium]